MVPNQQSADRANGAGRPLKPKEISLLCQLHLLLYLSYILVFFIFVLNLNSV